MRSPGKERLLCPEEEPKASDFGPLGKRDGIVDVDAKVAHGVLDVGMAEQDLHRAQITGRLVDQRRLRPSHRVRSVLRDG
jgi:hypothetical protein